MILKIVMRINFFNALNSSEQLNTFIVHLCFSNQKYFCVFSAVIFSICSRNSLFTLLYKLLVPFIMSGDECKFTLRFWHIAQEDVRSSYSDLLVMLIMVSWFQNGHTLQRYLLAVRQVQSHINCLHSQVVARARIALVIWSRQGL